MPMARLWRTADRSRGVANILCVTYDDPADGYPVDNARDSIPRVQLYPDGQTVPSPVTVDFEPGELLGSLSGGLGLRDFLAAGGHRLVVTTDRDGPGSGFDRALEDADVLISQ